MSLRFLLKKKMIFEKMKMTVLQYEKSNKT